MMKTKNMRKVEYEGSYYIVDVADDHPCELCALKDADYCICSEAHLLSSEYVREIKEDKKSKKLTVYEKFLRLPKVLVSKKSGVTIEYNFDIYFGTKFNDECSIEYTHYDPFFECDTRFRYPDIKEDVSWSGTFEECVEKAYNFFKKHGGLLEDEESAK